MTRQKPYGIRYVDSYPRCSQNLLHSEIQSHKTHALNITGPRIQDQRDPDPKEDVVSKYEDKAGCFWYTTASGFDNLAFCLPWF